ncbi:Ribosomal RNA small subunit methyltransferase H [Bienertia sinuspersici]
MKLNKSKNKGKVHPSPSSPSSCSSNEHVLNHLLPTAILTLISVLSLQDREALAYMITHSHPKNTNNSKKNKSSNNNNNKKSPSSTTHKSPCYDCCCFDCFSSFWNRWNSSPHRELIDQAIEAFEEHLASSEKNKKNKNHHSRSSTSKSSSSKKREKMGCSPADVEERESTGSPPVVIGGDVEEREGALSPETLVLVDVEEREIEDYAIVTGIGEDEEERESGPQNEENKLQQQQQHKGLARKVLPDVIGLFNSRLWNLWGPNV